MKQIYRLSFFYHNDLSLPVCGAASKISTTNALVGFSRLVCQVFLFIRLHSLGSRSICPSWRSCCCAFSLCRWAVHWGFIVSSNILVWKIVFMLYRSSKVFDVFRYVCVSSRYRRETVAETRWSSNKLFALVVFRRVQSSFPSTLLVQDLISRQFSCQFIMPRPFSPQSSSKIFHVGASGPSCVILWQSSLQSFPSLPA